MDNYEWLNYRAESKFGLFSIDFGATNRQLDFSRQRTKGAEAFRDIIEESPQNKNGTIADSAISKAKEKYPWWFRDSCSEVNIVRLYKYRYRYVTVFLTSSSSCFS